MPLTREQLLELKNRDPQLYEHIIGMARRKAQRLEVPPWRKSMPVAQRSFVEDDSKRKAALCSRRAGKSHGIGAWLYEGGLDSPGEISVYIALSRALSRKILWKALEQLDREFHLDLRFREIDNQLTIELPNKHQLWLAGCKDSGEIDKFRGPKYRRACIDEAQAYGPYLEELIEDVLDPALLDMDGELALTGTPGAIPTGYFYGATTGDSRVEKWPTHHWTCLSNPYLQNRDRELEEAVRIAVSNPNYINPKVVQFLERKKRQNKWDDDHPTYLREWCGQWVKDSGALVYPYDASRNSYWHLPQGNMRYSIGIDVGYVDSTAWTVAGQLLGSPHIYFVKTVKRNKTIPSAVAVYTQKLFDEFNTKNAVIDSGGIGKGYQEEMRQRYGVFAEKAKKSEKRAYIESMRGELLSGNIKVHPLHCKDLLDEWSLLIWDEDQKAPDESFEDHAADSALYNYRNIITRYRPELEEPELTHEQRVNREAAEYKKQLIAEMKRNSRRAVGRAKLMSDIASGKSMY